MILRDAPAYDRRAFPISDIAVTRSDDGTPQTIRGYAAVFNSLSEDLGGFREQIAPGAFARSLRDEDVVSLWQHDSSLPLGRVTNNRLELVEDEHGLRFVITPINTQWGRDALTTVDTGTVRAMSFGFSVRADGDKWERIGNEVIRTLIDVRLFEVSPVTWPAYPATSAATRDAWAAYQQQTAVPPIDRLANARRRLRLASV